ncbi:MAG: DUF1697 domain-containing protein [Acidimicrobiales bacterium]
MSGAPPATHVALLRGVNVGGRQRVAMDRLREVVSGLGHTGVRTYAQSGNLLLCCGRAGASAADVATEIDQAIAADMGVTTRVVVRTPEELAAVVAANPFTEAAAAAPTSVHVAFFSAPPAPGAPGLGAVSFVPDGWSLGDRVAYLHYAAGAGRSKLTNDVLERRLGVVSTARNWNTVTRLLALAI